VAPNATTEAQQAARDHIATIFTRPPPKSDRLTANAILKTLETIIGLPRQRSGTRRSCATFGRP
jgi:hypothetical protein